MASFRPKDRVAWTRRDVVLAGLLLAGLAGWWLLEGAAGAAFDWGLVGRSILRPDADAPLGWAPGILGQGLITTVKLSLWTMLLATVAGLAVGLARGSGRVFFRVAGAVYVEALRNTPPLVLAFLFYFFVGDLLLSALGVETLARSLPEPAQEALAWLLAPPGQLVRFLSALLTLALYEGAYLAEIVRAGIGSVERGQWEAAHALGLSPWQRLRHVVLPQALRRMLPPLAGQFISTIKDSAIVSAISIPELTFQSMEIMASTSKVLEIWLAAGGLYLLLCLGCSLLGRRLERRFPA